MGRPAQKAARKTDLDGYVAAVRGMAEADATEVHIAGYLATIEEQRGITNYTPRDRRAVSIALWHIAKVAEVRDRAMRLLEELRPADSAKQVSLSELLAERILSRDPPPEDTDS